MTSGTDAAVQSAIIAKQAKAGPNCTFLARNTNQALGIAHWAIDFVNGKLGKPGGRVLQRTELFHTDSVVCGLSALALRTNAPTVLRREALTYEAPAGQEGATVFGDSKLLFSEKAIVANCSAVREWDSNGTVFGYNAKMGKDHMAGEFGHNDFYPVAIAGCQLKHLNGQTALRAMLAIDEIRGRLAEVFSLKSYHIDHVVHGAIASAAVYGALVGATAKQIESAIGMTVAHFIPFRAIRAGEQLSDSKGASAAISTEVAIMSLKRSMAGFVGPADIFRNPEAIFRKFKPTTAKMTAEGDSPFDLVLTHSGDEFAVMSMHFKLGLYEHQSAGALQGLINLIAAHESILSQPLKSIKVVAYQPAFGIIGDPSKRNPTTRQSADHSMVFILARLLKRAKHLYKEGKLKNVKSSDEMWKQLMLLPIDYSRTALHDAETRELMELIQFAHGGPEYDIKYPEGIPTSIIVTDQQDKSFDSGLIMFPSGHAANTSTDLNGILDVKFERLAALATGGDEKQVEGIIKKLKNLQDKSAPEIADLYNIKIVGIDGIGSPKKGVKRAREEANEY